jgi:hypothetical protein
MGNNSTTSPSDQALIFPLWARSSFKVHRQGCAKGDQESHGKEFGYSGGHPSDTAVGHYTGRQSQQEEGKRPFQHGRISPKGIIVFL